MKRKNLYWIAALVTWALTSLIIYKYFIVNDDLFGVIVCGSPSMLLGGFIGAMVDGYLSSTYPDFLYTPFEEKREYAVKRIAKREELQKTMLYKMQYMQGLERTIDELNEIFIANRDLKLTRWIVFRAWYKNQIDHMVEYPEIYRLTINGGGQYSKEEDPLYDPNAPDWALFDREHNYDYDDDDDDDDDDFDYHDDNHRKSNASDAFAFGIGVGLVNGLTGGSVFGGGNSSSGS